MDLPEIEEYIPKTNTINKDRKYYIKNNVFIKIDEDVGRGKREAEFLKHLDHKYIQRYIRSYVKSGFHYLETDYFNSNTLENNMFSKSEIKIIQSQLLEVISYLSIKGIKHCDINVSNILYNGEKILLIDWETARFGDALEDLFGPPTPTNHCGIVNVINYVRRKKK